MQNEPLTLSIEDLPQDLYDAILDEFRQRYGADNSYDNWQISAEISTDFIEE